MSSYYQEESGFSFGISRAGVTYSVQLLILGNLCIFALQLLLDIPLGNADTYGPPGGSVFMELFSFSVDSLVGGWVWTPLTYMFVHGGLQHLFFNMLLLFFFGPEVERLLGTRQFLRFYLFCGFAGVLLNFLSAFLFPTPIPVSIVGASGAIMGVVIAFAIIDPNRQIYLIPFPFPITARAMVIIFIVMDLLTVAMGNRGTSVATHLGGMAVSFVYMKYRPVFQQWSLKRRRRPSKQDREDLGDAVDNIFKFQDKERRK